MGYSFSEWICPLLQIGVSLKNQRTNGPVDTLRLFALNELMVTFLKNETYGYV